uniref:nucleotidyl transferase AbiEii/AbiGii toxin family protein n=1 Tax=Prevotella heparinolytica TaxID=28113 RepID=UPI00359F954F
KCDLTCYELEELLGTKLRVLYQRRKGRDLFDLYWAMKNNDTHATKILECYRQYMKFVVEQPPTRKQFLANMETKLKDSEFITDMYAIIRPGISYRIEEAWAFIREILVENI